MINTIKKRYNKITKANRKQAIEKKMLERLQKIRKQML